MIDLKKIIQASRKDLNEMNDKKAYEYLMCESKKLSENSKDNDQKKIISDQIALLALHISRDFSQIKRVDSQIKKQRKEINNIVEEQNISNTKLTEEINHILEFKDKIDEILDVKFGVRCTGNHPFYKTSSIKINKENPQCITESDIDTLNELLSTINSWSQRISNDIFSEVKDGHFHQYVHLIKSKPSISTVKDIFNHRNKLKTKETKLKNQLSKTETLLSEKKECFYSYFSEIESIAHEANK
ncbi:hypothetical protein ACWJJH_02980 [Endozoicomonadaceae bacterium StTr2]